MLPWMDAHCHLTSRFHPDPLSDVLRILHEAACHGFVLGGVDPEDWREQLDIPSSPLHLIHSFGMHPWSVQERDDMQLEKDFAVLEFMLPQAGALGECGLDYFRSKTEAEREKQLRWFGRQLALAAEHDKPLILHVVRAHNEAVRLIKPYAGKLKGMVHSFWANPQTAKAWLDLGFYLSLPPRIIKLDNHGLLPYVPQDRILFESDSPEVFDNGTASDPRLALDLMKHVAWSKCIPVDNVLEQQNRNLSTLFPALNDISKNT